MKAHNENEILKEFIVLMENKITKKLVLANNNLAFN